MRLALCLTLALAALVAGQENPNKKAPAAATPAAAASTAVNPALKARVDVWWKAREVRDHRVMYDLLDSEYRAACSYEAFVAQNVVRTRFDITRHEVVSSTLEGDRAIVRLSYAAKTMQFGDQTMGLEEPWIRDGKGEWWKYWEPVAIPFPTPTPKPGTPRPLPCRAP